MLTRLRLIAAVAVCSVLPALSAQASSVQVRFDSVDPSLGVDYWLNGQKGYGLAGKYNWTNLSGSTDVPSPKFAAFCIELTQNLSFGTTYEYSVVNLDLAPRPGVLVNGGAGTGMGVTKANAIRELWGRHYDGIGSDSVLAREFQLAIWEIVYDFGGASSAGSSLLAQGLFQSTSTSGQASTWVRGLTGESKYFANLAALQSDGVSGSQDQVFESPEPTGGPNPVPLPASVFGGAALLGLLGLKSVASRRNWI